MKKLIGKTIKMIDLDKSQVDINNPEDLKREVLIVNAFEAQNAAGVFVQTLKSIKNNTGFWIGYTTACRYVEGVK